MDMGPACQPRSPLAFLSGGWATFPTLGMVPHITPLQIASPGCCLLLTDPLQIGESQDILLEFY